MTRVRNAAARGKGPGFSRPIERWQDLEAAGDRFMRAHGWRILRFSQRRASHQTEGIPDRLFVHRVLARAVWWEAKHGTGELTAEQEAVIADLEAAGQRVLVGGLEALAAYLVEIGQPRARGWTLWTELTPEARGARHAAAATLHTAAQGSLVRGPNGLLLERQADGNWKPVRRV